MSDTKEPPAIAAEWWHEMNFEKGPDGWRRSGGARRADLAKLRRAAGPIEALSVPAAVDLFRRLSAVRRQNPDRVAALAVALANLKPDLKNHSPELRVPQVFGRKDFDDDKSENRAGRRPLSEARFRRLLQTEEAELLDAFRRLIRSLGGRVEPESLARAILYWGDRTLRDWIFGYYGVPGAAPRAEAEPASSST
jgi:CRISPR type I-E-associated protein CasB/Cse2